MKSSAAMVLAAVILGSSILGAAFLTGRSIDSAADRFAELSRSLAAAEPARPAEPTARRGPDPEKAYKVSTEGAPSKGPQNAPLTLIEFSDFQCPFCARVQGTLAQIEKEYGDRVRIVFKHLPLPMHTRAPAAHAAAEAAHRQGRFWEMHDRIFANQRELDPEKYLAYAAEIGLDLERFKRDMASAEVRARVEADAREAATLGVGGTPGFFLNGKFFAGALPFSDFKRKLDAALGEPS